MKELFNDIVKMDGINGVLLLSHEGTVLFEEFLSSSSPAFEKRDWLGFVAALGASREADIVFKEARIYIRRSEIGYLLVLVSPSVSMAMLRLNCDILLPSLKPAPKPKGIKKLFKKR